MHIRIDEGIKRGPRKRRSTTPATGTPQTVRSSAVEIADLNAETVLNRYLEEPIHQIAVSYGLSEAQLYRWLLDNCEEGWRKSQIAKATAALERAKADIDNAQDPMQLAKAREKLKAAQWDLERLFARVYGLKQELKIDAQDRSMEIRAVLLEDAADLIKQIRGETNQPVSVPEALPDPKAPNGDTTQTDVP